VEALGRDVEAPTFSRQSAHRWRRGCQPYAPEDSWYCLLITFQYKQEVLGRTRRSDEFLLVHVGTVIFGSEFWESHAHILLSHVCFPLIRHVLHRKRRLQQFFYCVLIRCRGTCLPSRYQVTMLLAVNDRGIHRQQGDFFSLLLTAFFILKKKRLVNSSVRLCIPSSLILGSL
jgi:hypothetical protein